MTAAGVFTLSRSAVVNSDTANPLGAKLDLVVEDLGDPAAAVPPAPVVKYTGKLGPMGAVGAAAPGPPARRTATSSR